MQVIATLKGLSYLPINANILIIAWMHKEIQSTTSTPFQND